MSKKVIQPPKGQFKGKKMVEKSDLFSKIDAFINRNQSVLFWVSFVLTILFSILLFDIRVSLSGDDAGYLIRSNDFIYKSMYPSYQGPLYPIFISPFVYLFGINLVLLKTLSVFFILGHLFFFYRSFKDRIPALVLYFTVFIISINAYLLYFASQTYNEAFYLLVQSITVYVFVSFFIARDSENIPIKESYLRFLLLGFMLFLMGLTRSIGYGLFLSILIFYVISMRWKSIAYTFAGFFIFAVPFEFLKGLIYGNKEVLNSQLNLHLQKDFYNASKGFEDLPGFFERFLANSNLYLSKHLFMFLGFRPDDVTIKPYPLLAVTCYFIFFLAFIIIFRKNIYLLFTGIMVGVMTAITFVILQKTWDQGRLILIFYPSMLLLVFGGLYYLTKKYNLRYFQYLVVIFMGVVVFSTLGRTLERVKKQKEIVSHNLNGNLLFGLTDDWVNYINMSIWAAKNLPKDAVIATRKPTISFIYGNREFEGIYNVPSQDADTLLNMLKVKNIHYVIAASLRKYEARNTGEIINTVQRYLYIIQKKYPDKIKVINQIGRTEPAYLFEIVY